MRICVYMYMCIYMYVCVYVLSYRLIFIMNIFIVNRIMYSKYEIKILTLTLTTTTTTNTTTATNNNNNNNNNNDNILNFSAFPKTQGCFTGNT